MAMLTVPPYLEGVIGAAADVLEIGETTPSGSGALSYQSGWPAVTAMPLEAGGVAPQREYFNAVNKLLSQHVVFQQAGGLYPWDAALDYLANAHVQGSDGEEYIAVAPSGPDVPAAGSGYVGAQDPTTDTANAYWISASAKFGAPVASTTVRGVARLATSAEVQAGAAAAGSPAPAVVNVNDVRNLPKATTVLFGLGRSATDAEATAGATSGTGPAWVTPEQLAAGLAGKTDGTLAEISRRSASAGTGNWTITDVTIGKPLILLMDIAYTGATNTLLKVLSGGIGGLNAGGNFMMGTAGGTYTSTDCLITIPTSTTVVISISSTGANNTLYAFQ